MDAQLPMDLPADIGALLKDDLDLIPAIAQDALSQRILREFEEPWSSLFVTPAR